MNLDFSVRPHATSRKKCDQSRLRKWGFVNSQKIPLFDPYDGRKSEKLPKQKRTVNRCKYWLCRKYRRHFVYLQKDLA